MRKKWLIICASILLTAWVAINLNINVASEKKESSLKKANIEALASPESGAYIPCFPTKGFCFMDGILRDGIFLD